MSEEPGKIRRVTDYVGISESTEDRQRRPTGSKNWWLYTGATGLLVLAITVLGWVLL
jgi:hypothetical protein